MNGTWVCFSPWSLRPLYSGPVERHSYMIGSMGGRKLLITWYLEATRRERDVGRRKKYRRKGENTCRLEREAAKRTP